MTNIKISDFKTYFSLLGWKQTDFIGTAVGSADKTKFLRQIFSLKEFLSRLSENPIQPQQHENRYYSIALYASKTHSKQENVRSVKELVLDIDYGTVGHQRSQFRTEEEASAYIRTLPIPTVIIMSGGGYQLHYRLDGGAEKHDFMTTMQMLSEVWQIDHCTSCEHLYRLPFSYNCKDLDHIRPVQIIEAHNVGYSLDDFKKMIPKDFVFHAQKEKQIHQRTVRAIIDTPNGMDRSGTAFSIMLRAIGEYPDISDKTVESIIKKYPEIYAHYESDNGLRKDIRRAREKFHIDTIQPILPVEEVNISNIDLVSIEQTRKLFDQVQFSSRTEKMETTLKVLSKLISEKKSGILNVPCSSGKTFSALILLADFARRGKRAWLVSEKIEDCKRNMAVLQNLGINAQALHGRQIEQCRFSDKEFMADIEGCCRKCKNPCGAQLKYLDRNKFDLPEANIVCVTHQHYKSALFAQAIPTNIELIIIDEAPNLLENFSFRASQIMKIYDIFRWNENIAAIFEENWTFKVIQKLQDRGSHFIGDICLNEFKAEIRKYLWACRERNSISVDEQEFINQFVGFFSNNKVWGMRNGEDFCFKCGELTIDTQIPTIILDGSARNQITKWKKFSIFECEKLKMEYPHTTIYCIPANPTQSNLSEKKIFEEIISCADQHISEAERVLIFANKDLSNKGAIMQHITDLRNIFANKNCVVMDLPRGKHVGSNQGRNCSSTVIGMSLFSTIADYTLNASIFYQKEFKESDLFYVNNGKFIPKFKKNGDFQCDEVNQIYHRSLERDIYQAILRGKIRLDNEAEYKAIILVASPHILATLKEDLPKAKIIIVGENVVNLYHEGYSEAEISKMTNHSKQSIHDFLQRL